MELKAQFVKALPEKSGISNNGAWVSQEFIMNTGGMYPKDVAFELFNKSDLLDGIKPGETITVRFEPESKEFNGKYYTKLRCYAVIRANSNAPVQQQPQAPAEPAAPQSVRDEFNSTAKDDLPF